nr:hypothetical protein [Tanacetum cinerariifolium]
TATTATTSVVLQSLGYKTKTTMISVPVTYKSLADGKNMDVFLGNWMPTMENDIKAYRDAGTVEVECSNVGNLLKNLQFTVDMESELMGNILDDKMKPEAAAKAWLKKNPQHLRRHCLVTGNHDPRADRRSDLVQSFCPDRPDCSACTLHSAQVGPDRLCRHFLSADPEPGVLAGNHGNPRPGAVRHPGLCGDW